MDIVYNFKTKHKEGFTHSEIEELLIELYKAHPTFDGYMFWQALRGITVIVIDDEVIRYHTDIARAARRGIENGDLITHKPD